ncbi:CR2 protein, partial [Alaudala cheleensis]|nr:CR2 protein [Alaudala cheleensis]
GKHFLPLPFPAALCPLPRVRYGSVSPRRYYYSTRDTVTFTCSPGYTLRGPRSSTCGPGSRWDPPLPECKKGECAGRVSSAG